MSANMLGDYWVLPLAEPCGGPQRIYGGYARLDNAMEHARELAMESSKEVLVAKVERIVTRTVTED